MKRLYCFLDNSPESDRRDLLTELDTMKQLKPHPHVIKLLGCVTETGKLIYACEKWSIDLCPVIGLHSLDLSGIYKFSFLG